jgi:hypothetical protein
MDDPRYVQQWLWYRRWRRAAWLMFFLFMPFGALAATFCHFVFADENKAMWIIVPYLFAWVIVWNIAVSMRCPRCGKMFFRSWWYTNNFVQRCPNCRLPKYATFDPGDN